MLFSEKNVLTIADADGVIFYLLIENMLFNVILVFSSQYYNKLGNQFKKVYRLERHIKPYFLVPLIKFK